MQHDDITILFTGDFAPIGIAEKKEGLPVLLKIDPSMESLFKSVNLRITNLECPLTLSEDKIAKTGPHLKAHPRSVEILNRLDIDVVCLSNNHIRDYGDAGVLDTIETCKTAKIKTVGAGKNNEDASKPLILNIKSKRIAILNFSESEYNQSGETQAGSNPDDVIHIWRSIQEVKPQSDHQIVIMHGGKEMHPYPTPYQVNLYRFIADQGVDAIIGHHTHVIGGYEIYENTPIVYSLGNFLFDEAGNPPDWYHGALAKITLGCEYKETGLEFFHIGFQDHFLKLKESFNTGNHNIKPSFIQPINDSEVTLQWDRLIEKQYFGVVKSLLNLNIVQRVLIKFRLITLPNKKNFLMSLRNRFRCHTHRHFTHDSIHHYLSK